MEMDNECRHKMGDSVVNANNLEGNAIKRPFQEGWKSRDLLKNHMAENIVGMAEYGKGSSVYVGQWDVLKEKMVLGHDGEEKVLPFTTGFMSDSMSHSLSEVEWKEILLLLAHLRGRIMGTEKRIFMQTCKALYKARMKNLLLLEGRHSRCGKGEIEWRI
jgi:hypothetical protein